MIVNQHSNGLEFPANAHGSSDVFRTFGLKLLIAYANLKTGYQHICFCKLRVLKGSSQFKNCHISALLLMLPELQDAEGDADDNRYYADDLN